MLVPPILGDSKFIVALLKTVIGTCNYKTDHGSAVGKVFYKI